MTVLTRLRIGHTALTHKHLIKKTNPELCDCKEILSVEHIFESCPLTIQMRTTYNINRLKLLTDDNPTTPKKIIEFLKRIGFYNKI